MQSGEGARTVIGNVDVAGNLLCECMCVQGAWLWTAIAGRVGRLLSVLSG